MISDTNFFDVLKIISRLPLILSVTFHKVLANGLCSTNRIKNKDTLPCFFCGKFKDDLYHYMRCPNVSFIFGLPKAFGSIHVNYFKPEVLAKLAVFFETYYIVTRRYGFNLVKSPFQFIAYKTSYIGKHVAIKNKIQHLARMRLISYMQAETFINKDSSLFDAIVPDAADW